MSLDSLLWLLRELNLIIISPTELWPDPRIDRSIRRAMKRHRRGLAQLMRYSSIDVCPSHDLHRAYWRYSGGRYVCNMCEQLLPEVEQRRAA